jgi:hypothetical protein
MTTNMSPAAQLDGTNPGTQCFDETTITDSPGGDGDPCMQEKATIPEATHVEKVPSLGLLPSSWRPLILRAGPISGLFALIFAVLQVIVCYLILEISDGQPVATWRYQPSVYLAILTAISNKALAFAAVQGTVITFWLDSLRGTTVAQLHRDWAYGLHVYKAIFCGRHPSLQALACVCKTFVG